MILRRVIKHVRNQEWTAIVIDFFIVVFGVFIGLQVQQWTVERERQSSERQYLTRLHGEVELLIESRAHYDRTRPITSKSLTEVVGILAAGSDGNELSQAQCDAIADSSYITVPPADLPTVRELLSSGRLDQISSTDVREAILIYTQHVARTRDLITVIADNEEDLLRRFTSLIKVQYGPAPDDLDGVWLNPVCDTSAMRKDATFMNGLGINAYQYNVYTTRAVLPVSRALGALHDTLDQVLSIKHTEVEATP